MTIFSWLDAKSNDKWYMGDTWENQCTDDALPADQHTDSYHKDKTVARPSYLYDRKYYEIWSLH